VLQGAYEVREEFLKKMGAHLWKITFGGGG
jgi:hypothetical protein